MCQNELNDRLSALKTFGLAEEILNNAEGVWPDNELNARWERLNKIIEEFRINN